MAKAVLHLQKTERKKFRRDVAPDEFTLQSLSGDEIIQQLLDDNKVLLPIAILDLHGRWEPIFHNFLLHYNNCHNIPAPDCEQPALVSSKQLTFIGMIPPQVITMTMDYHMLHLHHENWPSTSTTNGLSNYYNSLWHPS